MATREEIEMADMQVYSDAQERLSGELIKEYNELVRDMNNAKGDPEKQADLILGKMWKMAENGFNIGVESIGRALVKNPTYPDQK